MKRTTLSKYFSAFLVILLFSRCDNSVDINAEWKETIIIYGLLDPNQNDQYIKVNKAYLNENTSALVVAKNSDSLYLNNAVVKLKRLNTGEEFILSKVDEIQKDSGIFASDVNFLYKLSEPVLENEPYEVEVTTPLGKSWANTWTLKKARIEAPFRTTNPIFSLGPQYITISYVPGTNAFAYDVKLKVNVEEYTQSDTSLIETKTLQWDVITNYFMPRGRTNSTVIHQVERTSFFQFLAYTLDTAAPVYRRIKSVSMEYYGGSQSLIDYISVNEPSIGIVQKQAEYTNINNGYGLFGSRCKQTIDNVPMDPGSVSILNNNKITAPLNFIY